MLATLAALLAGNEANRARLAHDVGYDTLLTVLTARMGPQGAPQGVLQQVLALALEVGFCSVFEVGFSSDNHTPPCHDGVDSLVYGTKHVSGSLARNTVPFCMWCLG